MMASGSNSFKGYSIVSCGILRPELTFLKESGFLDADKILYTTPGLHENQGELKNQLINQLNQANEYSKRIIVVYGSRCYLDFKNPFNTIDEIIAKSGKHISRVKAGNCIDTLANMEEREKIAGGQRIYWLTMGWLLFWKLVFKGWDPGKANETFPMNDKAVIMDPLNAFDLYSKENPEKVLGFSDWMKIPIESYPVSWKRIKRLLIQAKNKAESGKGEGPNFSP